MFKKITVKDWIAIVGILIGVSQSLVSFSLGKANEKLKRALDEEIRFRVETHYLMLNNEGIKLIKERLSKVPEHGKESKLSMVRMDGEEQPDSKGRYAGWSSFLRIRESSIKEPKGNLNQVYWLMGIKNRGSETIDALHIRFLEDSLEVLARNLEGGEEILIPLEVSGRHSDLTRTRKLTPVQAWFQYKAPGETPKKVAIEIPEKGTSRSIEHGVWQAMPILAEK